MIVLWFWKRPRQRLLPLSPRGDQLCRESPPRKKMATCTSTPIEKQASEYMYISHSTSGKPHPFYCHCQLSPKSLPRLTLFLLSLCLFVLGAYDFQQAGHGCPCRPCPPRNRRRPPTRRHRLRLLQGYVFVPTIVSRPWPNPNPKCLNMSSAGEGGNNAFALPTLLFASSGLTNKSFCRAASGRSLDARCPPTSRKACWF